MATENRRAGPALDEVLFDAPYRFEFFQAVRLLARLAPARALVGRHDASPQREVVRFRTRPTLQFPASEIYQITRRHNGGGAAAAAAETEAGAGRPEMMVSFMGLIGPLGVLPSHTTELIAERVRYKDTALWEFLDLFNHRMISLFYRAWERYRFTVAFERGAHDHFTDHLFALIGMGTRGLHHRLGLPDKGLLLYGGLLAQRPRSASAIAAVLGDYFNVPAALKQFAGQWLVLDEENLCRLGTINSQLGVGTIAGARVWDEQSKFRVLLGPLTLKQFKTFLPSGESYRPLIELVRFAAGTEFDFDVQLVLRAGEVPACSLTAENRPALGWTTWLKTQPRAQDDSQVVLAVNT